MHQQKNTQTCALAVIEVSKGRSPPVFTSTLICDTSLSTCALTASMFSKADVTAAALTPVDVSTATALVWRGTVVWLVNERHRDNHTHTHYCLVLIVDLPRFLTRNCWEKYRSRRSVYRSTNRRLFCILQLRHPRWKSSHQVPAIGTDN